MRQLDSDPGQLSRPSPLGEFYNSPLGVRTRGAVLAAGAGYAAYAAYGTLVAAGTVTVASGLVIGLAIAGAPVLVMGGIYVAATADDDTLEALQQVQMLVSRTAAAKALAKYGYNNIPHEWPGETLPDQAPDRDPGPARDPGLMHDSEEAGATPADIGLPSGPLTRPDPMKIDPPVTKDVPDVQDADAPVPIHGEFHDYRPFDGPDHITGDDGGSEGSSGPVDPCADHTGAHPASCD